MLEKKKKKKKSQISVDFVIVITIVIVIFLIMFSIVNRRNNELQSTRTVLYAKQIADKVATDINMIYLAGDGAIKTITVPETLKDTTQYTLKVYPSEHILNIVWHSQESKRQYSSTLITGNIQGNLTLTYAQSINIRNINDQIFLEVEFDTTPPIISNVKNTSITRSSALITWDTDEDSNSSVDYGFIEDSKLMVTSHSIQLTGLEKSTTYYYEVTSCDKYGNCATSDQYWFTTLTPQSGATSNDDFSGGLIYWDFFDWDKDIDESDPTGNWHDSGGDPAHFVSILIPIGSEDEVGGYWEQSIAVTVDNPETVNCIFDYRIGAYDPDPLTYTVSVYLDNAAGTPNNVVWSNSAITSTTVWSGINEIDCSSAVTTAGTYYYKLASWVETGAEPKGSFRAEFDNAKVEWEE